MSEWFPVDMFAGKHDVLIVVFGLLVFYEKAACRRCMLCKAKCRGKNTNDMICDNILEDFLRVIRTELIRPLVWP